MKNIEFVPDAFSEYQRWIEIDRRIALRIGDVIRDIVRTSYCGRKTWSIKTSIQRILEQKN